MKLVYQINLAFGLLLVIILGATAILIHYVLLDHLIEAQKREMRALGVNMANSLQSQYPVTPRESLGSMGGIPALHGTVMSLTEGMQAIVADPDGNVLSGMLPEHQEPEEVAYAVVTPAQTSHSSISSKTLQTLQAGKDKNYIVDVSPVPQGTLTLVTPMSKVRELERALFGRLLIVLGVGCLLVLLLSLVITRKLIRPLMKLREELKKVKDRRFGDVSIVQAGGEIGVVARTVHELAGELERYIRVQKQFFQNASHELKTPLMSIAGYAEGIRDGVFEGEDIRKGLDIIIGESGRLKKIVSEMTLLAKLDSEADTFRPASVLVKDLLDDTVERVTPLLTARGLNLALRVEEAAKDRIAVQADRDKLLQALLNVIANAARYANETIEVDAGVSKGMVVITVADDGEGIPGELLPHLFHRFVKGKDGENGLGLAISRAIVERSGGRIEAANREEGGALFELLLPAWT